MSDTRPPGPPQDSPERFADDARRYRLDARIATGGMGEVWRGTDTGLGRPVAIKLLKSEYADDPTFRSRFVTEARHAASLHHPGVAGVYDFGEAAPTDGSGMPRPFLVMELVDGQPLSNLLRGGRPLDPAAVQDLLAQAADAIGAAHRAGIVHRDVKPANLLVTPDRRIKITDFGIARASDGLGGLTGTGQVMGTPQYLSPEQARGGTATPASDVYSLGVVAFECLAGRRPFDADSPVATALAHLNDPVPSLPDTVPGDLAAVVRQALSKRPEDRFPDGDAFAAALRDPAAVVGMGAAETAFVDMPPDQDHTRVLGAPPAAAVPPVDPTATPAAPSGDDEDRRGAWPVVLLLVALAVAAVVLVVVVLTAGLLDDEPAATDTSSPTQSNTRTRTSEPTRSETTTEASPETFSIDPADYVGRDVDEAAADLRDLGLRVDTQEIDNPGEEDPDTVESVSPTKDLTEGDTVTLTYWGQPEPTSEPPTSESTPTSPTIPTGETTSAATTPSVPSPSRARTPSATRKARR